MKYEEAVEVIIPLILKGMDTIYEDNDYRQAEAALAAFREHNESFNETVHNLEIRLNPSDREDEEWAQKAKPCPICGAKMNLIKSYCVNTHFTGYRFTHNFGHCPLADLKTPIKETAEEAVLDWNYRKES